MKIHRSNKYEEPSFAYGLHNKKHILIVLICSIGLILASCSSSSTGPGDGNGDNGDDNGEGTPSEPTFSNVQVILENNCSGAGCHIGERTNGVRLDSYNNVINSVGTEYGREIVVPGEPDNSPIIDKISSNNPENGVRMPEGGPPLSDDQINLIRDWIAEGAQDN